MELDQSNLSDNDDQEAYFISTIKIKYNGIDGLNSSSDLNEPTGTWQNETNNKSNMQSNFNMDERVNHYLNDTSQVTQHIYDSANQDSILSRKDPSLTRPKFPQNAEEEDEHCRIDQPNEII
jgi:hypothetical protein